MHVRASHIRGMQVIDESTQYTVGMLDQPLIEPDTGKILGFFVFSFGLGTEATLFLPSIDILRWGTKIWVASSDVLSPPHELVRLKAALSDPRTVIHQPIRIRPGGTKVGICSDIQFDTKSFITEWLFPRRWFFARDPIPTTEIIEITSGAIWIKPPLRPSKAPAKTEEMTTPTLGVESAGASTMREK